LVAANLLVGDAGVVVIEHEPLAEQTCTEFSVVE
jgi:hypothetical protein